MKSAHTPGPWTAWGCTVYTDAGYRVAQTWDEKRCCLPTATMETNARLIASAPELLSALEAVMKAYVELVQSDYPPSWSAEKDSEVISARKAIAKAKGNE